MNEIKFEERKTIKQVEESTELAPKFDQDGLIPVVTTDFSSGEVFAANVLGNLENSDSYHIEASIRASKWPES